MPADQTNRPFGELLLGGEVRRFRLGYAALANLSDLGDDAVRRAFLVISGQQTGIAAECAAFRDWLWAALSIKHPGLKTETVARWLDDYAAENGTMVDIYKAVIAAWDMPKVKPEEPAAEGDEPRPTDETTAH